MRRRPSPAGLVGLLVALWLALLAGPVIARPLAPEEAQVLFAQDAADHRIASNRLGAARGAEAESRMSRWNTGRPATIASVAAILDPANAAANYPAHSALLFYATQEHAMRLYLIDGDGLRAAVEVESGLAEIELAGLHFRQSLAVDEAAALRSPQLRDLPQFTGAERDSFDRDAEALADLLLPRDLHGALAGVEHLVIVGDGVIAGTPFAALPFGEGQQLIDRMTVSVAGGLYDLSRRIGPWDGASAFHQALVVGDPTVPAMPRWRVPGLPGAALEAREVARLSGMAPLLAGDATRSALAARAPAARVIYIAAHAVADPGNPLAGGFIMLAGTDETDSFWTAGEIQQNDFAADLAVLSACQTGLGRNVAGGVIGLSRAFHLAGVPRVVMSLWSVDDAATLFLMTRFTHYAMTESPAVALRRAMLDARAENDDPALWASFTLFGTPR